MAKPNSRQSLIDYCLRKLGAPVLEINVADEQIDDAVDDALQLFHERHFDGVARTLLKYRITSEDKDRGRVVLVELVLLVRQQPLLSEPHSPGMKTQTIFRFPIP